MAAFGLGARTGLLRKLSQQPVGADADRIKSYPATSAVKPRGYFSLTLVRSLLKRQGTAIPKGVRHSAGVPPTAAAADPEQRDLAVTRTAASTYSLGPEWAGFWADCDAGTSSAALKEYSIGSEWGAFRAACEGVKAANSKAMSCDHSLGLEWRSFWRALELEQAANNAAANNKLPSCDHSLGPEWAAFWDAVHSDAATAEYKPAAERRYQGRSKHGQRWLAAFAVCGGILKQLCFH